MATASWEQISIKVDPFGSLKDPLKSALQVLEAIEAVLEAILDIVKAFLIDFGNPLKAVFALLLAAVRAIINQIKSTGFSILVVHPDFSRQDFASIIQSVAGSYPAFESKVVRKFYDSSDIFRPQYPPGSAVGMLVFYIGTDSPGDLLLQLFALMQLISTPIILTGPPAPTNVKVNPVRKSGDPIASFKDLFGTDISKSLSIEWQMPLTPSGSRLPGFMNALVSFYNSFRFPNFIIERSETPQGEVCEVEVNSSTMGNLVGTTVTKYDFSPPVSIVPIKEMNGNTYRNFATKINVSGSDLLQGVFTSTYRFVDTDPNLEPGKAYFYRIRAYFGDATIYLNTNKKPGQTANDVAASISANAQLVKYRGNQPVLNYGNNVVMGAISPVVRGFVPRITTGAFAFNPYDYIYQAVQVAILLNFEYPPAQGQVSAIELDQRTGWGTLAALAGQMSPLKAALKTSDALIGTLVFNATCRRAANQTLTNLYSQPKILYMIAGQWNDGVRDIVNKVLNAPFTWSFPSVVGGYTAASNAKIEAYLSNETSYIDGIQHLNGPYPTRSFKYQDEPVAITADDRRALANFLQLCLTSLGGGTSYLSWYSVTVGDLFPAFIPFIFDFEQWLLALLHALQTAMQAIEDIIETLIIKIQQLEQMLRSILAIIDLLNVNVRVSVLATTTSGSSDDLVTALISSQNKPFASPFGLHSGIVCTAGGPGVGTLAALNAIRFILSLPL